MTILHGDVAQSTGLQFPLSRGPASLADKFMRGLVLVLLVFGCIATQAAELPAAGDSSTKAKPSAVPAGSNADAKHVDRVEISGLLSAKTVGKGGRVSGLVTIANYTGGKVTGVHIVVAPLDGFEFRGGSISGGSNGGIHCEISRLTCDLANGLSDAEERSVTLTWAVTASSAEQSVNATVAWTSTQESSRTISLGQVACLGWFDNALAEHTWLSPLLIGVLGGLVVAFGQSAMAFFLKRGEEERSHLTTTWEKMLPESHKLGMQHYVHIQAFVRNGVRSLELYRDAPATMPAAEKDDLVTRAFLSLLLFDKRMQYAAQTVGGAYFKNRTAEEIVGWCYKTYREAYYDVNLVRRSEYEHLLRIVKPKTTLGDAFALLTPPTPPDPDAAKAAGDVANAKLLNDAKAAFILWAASAQCNAALPFLKAFRAVMTFEMNRPYRYWYAQDECLELSAEAEQALGLLGKNVMKGNEFTAFQLKIQSYVQEAKTKGTATP
jgi:hypothetical protein